MKAMSLTELKTFVTGIESEMQGAQLQEIVSNDRGLALAFRGKEHYWMVLDLNPATPFCLVFPNENPFKKGPKPKPVALFLNSHAKNLYLRKIEVQEAYGRVMKIELANVEKLVTLELVLIPKQANLLVQFEDKRIAWEKPRELKMQGDVGELPTPRNVADIHAEWLADFRGGVRPSMDPKMQWEKKRTKDLEKKRKALSEIEKILQDNVSAKLFEVGNYLKTLLPEDFKEQKIALELRPFLDFQKSIFANIHIIFEKAKQAAGKIEGTETRKQVLFGEIEKLEKSTYEQSSKNKSSRPKMDDLMQKIDAKGRKLHLESGAIIYCGKHAADNLALLRRAKAWDYWLHLKDYPGAHAIVHRTRDQEITPAEIQKAALWVLKESVGSKVLIEGQKYAVVLVECRFVRPIKGDKLGRVTYHSEKQFLISS